MKRQGVTLYEVCLVSFLVFWFMERVGAFAPLTPAPTFIGDSLGFAVPRLAVFALIWFVLWYVDRNLTPRFVRGMRSNQGVAKGVDLFILLACLALAAITLGATYAASAYFWLMSGMVGLAAVQSLLVAGERPQSAAEQDVTRSEGEEEPGEATAELTADVTELEPSPVIESIPYVELDETEGE